MRSDYIISIFFLWWFWGTVCSNSTYLCLNLYFSYIKLIKMQRGPAKSVWKAVSMANILFHSLTCVCSYCCLGCWCSWLCSCLYDCCLRGICSGSSSCALCSCCICTRCFSSWCCCSWRCRSGRCCSSRGSSCCWCRCSSGGCCSCWYIFKAFRINFNQK